MIAKGKPLEQLDILGVPLSVLASYEESVALILDCVRARQKTFCVAINPEKIHAARRDDHLMSLLSDADLHICDGIGAALASWVLHGRRVTRITGIQLFNDLLTVAARKGLRVFLLGASLESNAEACRRLRQQYPQLRIAGRQSGYFEQDLPVLYQINQSRPDLLFIGMGSPRQEMWLSKHRDGLDVPFCMGIGGSLDVLSGRAKWAPRFFRRTGTEFLYRLCREPHRWRRQLSIPTFLLHVLWAKVIGVRARPATTTMPANALPPRRKAA